MFISYYIFNGSKMKKKLDVIMIVATFIFVLYSSTSMLLEGFIKTIPATPINIAIVTSGAMVAIVGSHWKAFYVDGNDTIATSIISALKNETKK